MNVYQIVYKPWKNNTENKPWLYIGSDSKNRTDYMGSVSSREWKEFWRYETKNHPERFEKIILANLISNDRFDLLDLELKIQEQYNVVNSSVYFNKSYASKGCFGDKNNHRIGLKHTDETKKKMSDSRKKRIIKEETKTKMSISAKKRIEKMHLLGEKPKGMSGKNHTNQVKENIKLTISQLKWWTNGKINKRSKQQPGPEWINRRLK